MSSKKIAFVTGGTGFVGSHLAEELLRRGYDEVRCLVRSDPKWLRGLPIVPIRGSLADVSILEDAVLDATHVYHVAGLTRAPDEPSLIRANVVGTINLLTAVSRVAPNIEHVQITSSLATIGASDNPVADERTSMRPLSAYGRSKAMMERRVLRLDDTLVTGDDRASDSVDWSRRVPLSIVRPPAVYGPRESDIFTFFQTVSRGICPIIGSGRNPALSLVHVRDLTRGMVDLAEHGPESGEVFFLGSEDYYSWNRIRAATIAAFNRRVWTIRVPERAVPFIGAASEMWGQATRSYPPLNREKANEILNACKMCSIDKAMRTFGFRQKVELETGIEQTIEWYRKEGWLK
ncbi:MAG: NAD-dependent epimerase/dehydratase family protein [Rhodothermales bacterium]|nr:NAD-dependent epimerase/dehydratase family protein [Rhodothermales bacterium]